MPADLDNAAVRIRCSRRNSRGLQRIQEAPSERTRADQTLGALDALAYGLESELLEIAVRDAMLTASFGLILLKNSR